MVANSIVLGIDNLATRIFIADAHDELDILALAIPANAATPFPGFHCLNSLAKRQPCAVGRLIRFGKDIRLAWVLLTIYACDDVITYRRMQRSL